MGDFIVQSGDCAFGGVPVVPNDDVDLPGGVRAIAFTTAGAISVIWLNGEENIIPSGLLAAGMLHPIQVSRIKASGTTAQGIWAFF